MYIYIYMHIHTYIHICILSPPSPAPRVSDGLCIRSRATLRADGAETDDCLAQ